MDEPLFNKELKEEIDKVSAAIFAMYAEVLSPQATFHSQRMRLVVLHDKMHDILDHVHEIINNDQARMIHMN